MTLQNQIVYKQEIVIQQVLRTVHAKLSGRRHLADVDLDLVTVTVMS